MTEPDTVWHTGPQPQHPLEAPSPWAEAALAVDGALDYFHTLSDPSEALRAAIEVQIAVTRLMGAVRESLPPVSLAGIHDAAGVSFES